MNQAQFLRMINSQSKTEKQKYENFQFLRQKRAELNQLLDFHNVSRSSKPRQLIGNGLSTQNNLSDFQSNRDSLDDDCEYHDKRNKQKMVKNPRNLEKLTKAETKISRKEQEISERNQRLGNNSIINLNISTKKQNKTNILITAYGQSHDLIPKQIHSEKPKTLGTH